MDNTQRKFLTRLLAGYALFFWLLHFTQYTTPSRLLAPPLFTLGLDITYWTFRLSGLMDLIVYNRTGAIVFDAALLTSGILTLIFPLRKWVIVFSILLSLYAVAFSSLLMHHVHIMTGLFIVFIPFWFRDNETSDLLWQAVRYYTCYIYSMAFLWKTVLGDSFFSLHQGSLTFQSNLVEYMYHDPQSFFAGICRWCIRNPWLTDAGEKFVIGLEGLMIVGFFTKRYDRLLFWCPVFIHVSTYFFSDVLFLELLIVDFSLLSWRQLDAMRQWRITRPRPAAAP